jgi:hypothetical protein
MPPSDVTDEDTPGAEEDPAGWEGAEGMTLMLGLAPDPETVWLRDRYSLQPELENGFQYLENQCSDEVIVALAG